MEKLIIENRTDLGLLEILGYVGDVINIGKISKTSKGKQYCFITTYKGGIVVYADKNKKSDRLIITKEAKEDVIN